MRGDDGKRPHLSGLMSAKKRPRGPEDTENDEKYSIGSKPCRPKIDTCNEQIDRHERRSGVDNSTDMLSAGPLLIR